MAPLRLIRALVAVLEAAGGADMLAGALDISDELPAPPPRPEEVTIYLLRDARGLWYADAPELEAQGRGVTPWLAARAALEAASP